MELPLPTSLIDFLSSWISQNVLNWFSFYLDVVDSFLTYFVSLWLCWNVLNWFRFYLAIGASVGHHLPTRPLFWKKRFTYRFGLFQIVLIFVSIRTFGNVLNWFISYWGVLKLSQLISFLLGCFEMFSIDFFAIQLLGHPWGTLYPSFETSDLPSYLDCFKIFWIDFFSIWVFGNVLNWFLLNLVF